MIRCIKCEPVQWTYQAMVHELLGIEKNRVVINKELQKLKDAQKDHGSKGKADDKAWICSASITLTRDRMMWRTRW